MKERKGLFWEFVRWVKPSFEGKDGTASYRRFTAFALGILNTYLIFCDKLDPSERINAFYANLVVICLIIGIVTAQNILSFFNRGENQDSNKNPGENGFE